MQFRRELLALQGTNSRAIELAWPGSGRASFSLALGMVALLIPMLDSAPLGRAG